MVCFGDEIGAVGKLRGGEIALVEHGGTDGALHGCRAGTADGIPLCIEIESDGMGPVAVSERDLRIPVANRIVAEPDGNVELSDQSFVSETRVPLRLVQIMQPSSSLLNSTVTSWGSSARRVPV